MISCRTTSSRRPPSDGFCVHVRVISTELLRRALTRTTEGLLTKLSLSILNPLYLFSVQIRPLFRINPHSLIFSIKRFSKRTKFARLLLQQTCLLFVFLLCTIQLSRLREAPLALTQLFMCVYTSKVKKTTTSSVVCQNGVFTMKGETLMSLWNHLR